MKFYDKYLTPVSKEIQQTVLMLIVFVIGFVAGYFVGNYEKQSEEEQVNNMPQTAYIQIYENVKGMVG